VTRDGILPDFLVVIHMALSRPMGLIVLKHQLLWNSVLMMQMTSPVKQSQPER